MESKINIRGIKISPLDIIDFLVKEECFEDIDHIYMMAFVNNTQVIDAQIGDITRNESITIRSGVAETINKLEILFYKRDKYSGVIYYGNQRLILPCKNDEEKLYFMCGDKPVKIEAKIIKEYKLNSFKDGKLILKTSDISKTLGQIKNNKKNSFAFGNWIFFGGGICILVYATFQNNKEFKEFIDFNDAQKEFRCLFCIKSNNGWIIESNTSEFLDKFNDICFDSNKEKINELKIFIRHENYTNFLKDKKYGGDIPNNNIDLNELRKRGYFEFDVKENKDETGFKYKLVDRKDNLISYAVDYSMETDAVDYDYNIETETQRLTNYLSRMYDDSKRKNFIEKFNLGLSNCSLVLKDKVKGIYLTDYDASSGDCIVLGTDTKLVFTKEFSDELKQNGGTDNKFYVLPQSQAFKDISDFIATTGLVPFGSLSFINQEIVKLYDTEKHVENNLNGKDMTTLCICDFKIDPNLQNDQFSNDLTKLCEIDDGYKCAIALIELLSKIKDPNSNFEYELSSFENGKLIPKTNDISKTLGQIKNNKKNSFAFGNSIFFDSGICILAYAISINNKEFIDFDDARPKFYYLFCIRSGNVWIMKQSEICFLDSFYIVDFHGYNWEKIDELKLFIRQNSYKNTCKDKRYCGNIPNNNIDLNELRKRGYFEIDVKENNDETGFKYKLVDREDNLISYAVDYDGDLRENREISRLLFYLETNMYVNMYNSRRKEFIEKFNLGLNNCSLVLKDKVKGIYLTNREAYCTTCVVLGTDTKLVFTKEFSDKLKQDEGTDNKFYVLPQSQAFKDISDFIATTGLVPFRSLSFINPEIVKLYDTKKRVEDNLNGKDMTTLYICDFKIDPNLQNDQFSNDLTKLYKIDNGSECAVALLIELLSKIKDPNSNFEYELNSFKDGKSILKTHGIYKMPKIRGQIKNNKKEEAAWLEGRKAQAFESPRPSVENVNDVEDLDLYS